MITEGFIYLVSSLRHFTVSLSCIALHKCFPNCSLIALISLLKAKKKWERALARNGGVNVLRYYCNSQAFLSGSKLLTETVKLENFFSDKPRCRSYILTLIQIDSSKSGNFTTTVKTLRSRTACTDFGRESCDLEHPSKSNK